MARIQGIWSRVLVQKGDLKCMVKSLRKSLKVTELNLHGNREPSKSTPVSVKFRKSHQLHVQTAEVQRAQRQNGPLGD